MHEMIFRPESLWVCEGGVGTLLSIPQRMLYLMPEARHLLTGLNFLTGPLFSRSDFCLSDTDTRHNHS